MPITKISFLGIPGCLTCPRCHHKSNTQRDFNVNISVLVSDVIKEIFTFRSQIVDKDNNCAIPTDADIFESLEDLTGATVECKCRLGKEETLKAIKIKRL